MRSEIGGQRSVSEFLTSDRWVAGEARLGYRSVSGVRVLDLQPGVVVQTMVLDTLSGRCPLYRLKEFLTDRDVELLVGEDIPANAFSDVNVGRSLDAIFEAGPSKIVTVLGVRATDTFALDTSVPSYDTTSTSLW